jgi:hypothetical protein
VKRAMTEDLSRLLLLVRGWSNSLARTSQGKENKPVYGELLILKKTLL